MTEVQTIIAGWLSSLTGALPVGLAFGAGMIAAVNPCGFAMLPAYLSLYLGAEESDFGKRSSWARLLRALLLTISKPFLVRYHLRRPRKKRCRCPSKSRFPLSGALPRSCGRSSNRFLPITTHQRAPVVRA